MNDAIQMLYKFFNGMVFGCIIMLAANEFIFKNPNMDVSATYLFGFSVLALITTAIFDYSLELLKKKRS